MRILAAPEAYGLASLPSRFSFSTREFRTQAPRFTPFCTSDLERREIMTTLKRLMPVGVVRSLWVLGIAVAVVIVLGGGSVAQASDETTVRWDIVSLAAK